MIASFFIMRDVFIRSIKNERIKLTHKIVFEMSLANFWGTFFTPFLSTWMVPKDSGAYQAAGNTASCTAQGFFDSFFCGTSVFMNAVLALTYCIIVKRGKKDEAKSTRNLWIVLGLPPIICFLLAIKPFFDRAYNYNNFLACDIAEYPLGCLSENSDYECTRGSNARELKIARFACVWLANFIIVVSVAVLIQHVVSTERRMNANSTESSNDLSIKTTWQGIFYVAAFMFSWVPWYIWQWIQITSGTRISSLASPALVYIISITHPLQGVGNALVYFRPRYKKFRERDHEELRLASVLRTLDITVPPILSLEWWRSLIVHSRGFNFTFDKQITINEDSHDATKTIIHERQHQTTA